ncbi:hypothetical protein SAMN05216570_2489 [Dyella sp. OK004]|uniref:hypothetical protein n=1 Tax=Dyella sp. OK004 TaxID=1855292 RepID=UPI0008EF344E|nr:hypothetical protein [Dyella sp. OK004]SFS08969.1 hypothetical protein SAMN05216570_2489 [Dyella sp. OK004]
MQSSMKRGVRRMIQIAIVSSLASAAWLPSAFAAQAGDSHIDAVETQAHADWRETMAHSAAPAEGCYQADYPSILWKQVGCNVAPARFHSIPPHPHAHPTALARGATQTTGNGNDYAIQTSTLIKSTTGTFPSVTGVTSEQGVGVPAFGGGGILGPNEYTLQINSNFDGSTAACRSHSGCTVWQQFIYSPDYNVNGQAAVFMQYWLIGYGGTSCPSGFGSDGGGDCYKNSAAVAVPDIPATQLANLKLSGTVVSGGNDTVTFTNGTKAYSISGKDSVLYLAQVWKESEFNVVGNAGGSEAVFNSGSSVTVKVAVNDGSTATPTCAANSGTTGETNNFNLGNCTASGGSTPYIQFTESN